MDHRQGEADGKAQSLPSTHCRRPTPPDNPAAGLRRQRDSFLGLRANFLTNRGKDACCDGKSRVAHIFAPGALPERIIPIGRRCPLFISAKKKHPLSPEGQAFFGYGLLSNPTSMMCCYLCMISSQPGFPPREIFVQHMRIERALFAVMAPSTSMTAAVRISSEILPLPPLACSPKQVRVMEVY